MTKTGHDDDSLQRLAALNHLIATIDAAGLQRDRLGAGCLWRPVTRRFLGVNVGILNSLLAVLNSGGGDLSSLSVAKNILRDDDIIGCVSWVQSVSKKRMATDIDVLVYSVVMLLLVSVVWTPFERQYRKELSVLVKACVRTLDPSLRAELKTSLKGLLQSERAT
jgi:hypothetical protein